MKEDLGMTLIVRDPELYVKIFYGSLAGFILIKIGKNLHVGN